MTDLDRRAFVKSGAGTLAVPTAGGALISRRKRNHPQRITLKIPNYPEGGRITFDF